VRLASGQNNDILLYAAPFIAFQGSRCRAALNLWTAMICERTLVTENGGHCISWNYGSSGIKYATGWEPHISIEPTRDASFQLRQRRFALLPWRCTHERIFVLSSSPSNSRFVTGWTNYPGISVTNSGLVFEGLEGEHPAINYMVGQVDKTTNNHIAWSNVNYLKSGENSANYDGRSLRTGGEPSGTRLEFSAGTVACLSQKVGWTFFSPANLRLATRAPR